MNYFRENDLKLFSDSVRGASTEGFPNFSELFRTYYHHMLLSNAPVENVVVADSRRLRVGCFPSERKSIEVTITKSYLLYRQEQSFSRLE